MQQNIKRKKIIKVKCKPVIDMICTQPIIFNMCSLFFFYISEQPRAFCCKDPKMNDD